MPGMFVGWAKSRFIKEKEREEIKSSQSFFVSSSLNIIDTVQ